MSNAVTVTDDSFAKEVLEGDQLVVVDFWAEWCAPCRLIAPVLDELAGEYAGRVKVAKLNIDENPGVSMKMQVRSIPTLVFFKDGQKVDQIIGVVSKHDLKKKFDGLA